MTEAAMKHSVHARGRNGQWAPREDPPPPDNLFNERTFYPAFAKDLASAKREVVIYSPFVSKYRAELLAGEIRRLRARNVDVFVFTRPAAEYDRPQRAQAAVAIASLEQMGACVFCLGGSIHEKAAIIDREILWEGSLNILSQRSSREMMRRTRSEGAAVQMIGWLGLNRSMAEGYRAKYERLCRELEAGQKRRRKVPFALFPLLLCSLLAAWWLWALSSGTMVHNGNGSLADIIRLLTAH
jgi:phosphatidylserine/phosphatidylglycerophosphate/cardiolipin synthase-like enzyme